MAETKNTQGESELGCGLVGAIFQLGGMKPRKASVAAIPAENGNENRSSITKRRRGSSREMETSDLSISAKPPTKPLRKPSSMSSMPPKPQEKNQSRRRTASGSFMSSVKSSNLFSSSQVVNEDYTQRLRRAPTFTSSEWSVNVHRKSNVSESMFQASTSSVMLVGHLGNLKQRGNNRSSGVKSSKTMQKGNASGRFGTTGPMGNILRNPTTERSNSPGKLDPEELKSMGNKKFREGNYEEALALYNQAIALDSSKPSFYSNKSAALMGLGQLIEAAFECTEAIRIEPAYPNAQYRLARLYIRLGEAEKAALHFKHSGRKASSSDIFQAQALEAQLSRCSEARKQRDWDKLLSECHMAITMGADSAPQIYAMRSEALMKLRRHEEAYSAIEKEHNFDIDLCTQLLGPVESATLLTIRSQVYMSVGRFEDAVTAAQHAASLHPSSEVAKNAKSVSAIAAARSTGNELFNASRFPEASVVYSAALEQEPHNSVLLCNRAACRSNLGLFEKAVDDCTTALYLRPSYNKARLRRAYCNAKLEKWEAALRDYDILMLEVPGNKEVTMGFIEAKKQLEREHNYVHEEPKTSNLKSLLSNEPLAHIITAAEFYGGSNSFKNGIDASFGPNCAAPKHGRSPSSLQPIPIH